MAIGFNTDDEGRATVNIDNLTECSVAGALGFSWLILRDDRGNQVNVHVPPNLALRLHETWAATAITDHSDLARAVA
jgi:hypothetical protein